MTDFDFLKVFPASFRGVPFFVEYSDTTGGRKKVVHEYVNSNRRSIEDLGQDLKSFRVEGLIRGNGFIGDYQENKLALIRALEAEGPGILVHPFFGTLRVDLVGPYTARESFRQFGVCYFSMYFEESLPNIFPVISGSNINRIIQNAKDAYAFISQNIKNVYRGRGISSGTLIDSANKIASIADTFESIFQKYRSGSQSPNAFFNSIQSFRKNVFKMAVDSSLLATNIVTLFDNANEFAATAEDAFDIGKDVFNFGDNDVNINVFTVDLEDRVNNRTVINEMVQACGLVQSYRAASTLSYETTVDISNTLDLLESQFAKFEGYTLSDQDVLDSVKNLRNEIRKYIDNDVEAQDVTTITTRQIPMTILAYNYYGDTENVDALLALNPDQDVSFTEGEVTIFRNN